MNEGLTAVTSLLTSGYTEFAIRKDCGDHALVCRFRGCQFILERQSGDSVEVLMCVSLGGCTVRSVSGDCVAQGLADPLLDAVYPSPEFSMDDVLAFTRKAKNEKK